ncbi:MAG: PorP/SprF family type IX secretion system membrane protein [Sphingobacteriaceae bacterium]|nr:PorP/SprF family type IX secretion system membrane protein [Sphingobacteriaceae bacterium]
MNKIKKLIVLFLIGVQSLIKAQDFHLSLYDAAPLFLNPAMAGLVDGKMRAHAQYRNQWNAIAFKPFTTALISFDMPYKKWGFGGQISNMRAGFGNYNVLQFLTSAAYAVPIDKNRYHNLSLGLQAGFTQKRIEYQIFTFDNQWSTVSGGSFDKGLNNNENFSGQTAFQAAVNAGFLYYYAKQQSRINPFLGFSAFNLTQPKESFTGYNNKLPIRMYTHAGVRINISELFYAIPKVLIYQQKNILQQTYALDAGYYFKGEKFYALAGYIFRASDANIFNVGFRKDNYIVKLGYDFNTSSLRNTSKSRGAYEISFTWLGRKAKNQDIKNCPRL